MARLAVPGAGGLVRRVAGIEDEAQGDDRQPGPLDHDELAGRCRGSRAGRRGRPRAPRRPASASGSGRRRPWRRPAGSAGSTARTKGASVTHFRTTACRSARVAASAGLVALLPGVRRTAIHGAFGQDARLAGEAADLLEAAEEAGAPLRLDPLELAGRGPALAEALELLVHDGLQALQGDARVGGHLQVGQAGDLEGQGAELDVGGDLVPVHEALVQPGVLVAGEDGRRQFQVVRVPGAPARARSRTGTGAAARRGPACSCAGSGRGTGSTPRSGPAAGPAGCRRSTSPPWRRPLRRRRRRR